MATKSEIEAVRRRLRKLSEEEAATRPNWKALAKKSNAGLKRSTSAKKRRQDALARALPGPAFTKS